MLNRTVTKSIGGGLPLVVVLAAGLVLPARADTGQPEDRDRPALNAAEKRVDLDRPPPQTDKEPAVNAAGEALAPEGGVSTKLKGNCGIIRCSLYLSRKETRQVAAKGVAAGIFAGLVHKLLGAVTGLLTYSANEAAKKNQCLRIVYGPTAISGMYSDNSKYCYN
jgi:hypothetical protein